MSASPQINENAPANAPPGSTMPTWRRFLPFPDMMSAFVRFPAPTFVAAAAALTVVGDTLALPLLSDLEKDWLEVAALLFFASLLPSLLLEGRRFQQPIPALAGFAGLAVGAAWWLLPPAWGPDVRGAPLLAALGVALLCGLAAFPQRYAELDRFWIWHQRAVLNAVFTGLGAAILLVGLFAVERSLDILFGIDLDDFVFDIVLPVVLLFLVPVSWLVALTPVGDLPRTFGSEDSVIRNAVSILARFVAVPLLAVYTGLLIAYALKIALDGALPQNQIGWMVTAFGTTGAATMLMLYPDRDGSNGFVRLFWRAWFALTVLPLGMLALAIWQRIGAHGLTEERVMLAAGFAWLVGLAVVYLWPASLRSGPRDLRPITGLAGLVLLIISVGPLNLEAVSVRDQASRVLAASDAIEAAGEGAEEGAEAALSDMKGALGYLRRHQMPKAVIARAEALGFANDGASGNLSADVRTFLTAHYGLDALEEPNARPVNRFVSLRQGGSIEVASGVWLHGPFSINNRTQEAPLDVDGISFSLEGAALVVGSEGQQIEIDLAPVFAMRSQQSRQLDEMTRIVSLDGRVIRVLIRDGSLQRVVDGPARLGNLTFFVFLGAAS